MRYAVNKLAVIILIFREPTKSYTQYNNIHMYMHVYYVTLSVQTTMLPGPKICL